MGKARPRAEAESPLQDRGLKANDLRCYGRRIGRPLRKHASTLMETLLPRVAIKLPARGALNPAKLFDKKTDEIFFEVGFGGGEHLAAHAMQNPKAGCIGCEPFLNATASLLQLIDKNNLQNVRIYPDDARLLLAKLPDACLTRVFVMFADPWRKKRHENRRFINPDNLKLLARVMKPGAVLCAATDDPVLIAWTEKILAAAPDFKGKRLSTRPDWPQTRYEEKALAAGRKPAYFAYQRI